ncbi:MAG: hypothetical protein GF404_09535 [candidate division Zixibacteria bacterium]|nr:hypothetical protein [candidate division Zixibacteria bacterium]
MKSSTGKASVFTGSLVILAISGLHIYFIFAGPEIYRFFGAGEKLASMLESGSVIPTISTFVLAIVFALFAVYGLALAGFIKELPFQKQVVLAVSIIFILRSLLMLKLLADPENVPLQMILFSLVALLVGLLYLHGWLELRNSTKSAIQTAGCR